MPKPEPPNEWYIAESDDEWQRLCVPSTTINPVPVNQRHLPAHRFWGGVALLLCLLVGGWGGRGGIRVQRKEVAVRATASLHPIPATPAGDAAIVSNAALVPEIDQPPPPDRSRLAVQKMEFPVLVFDAAQPLEIQGDRALGRVVLYTEHGEAAYRQTRFYLHIPTGWIRTDPDATLWGSPRRLETPSFVFHFRQRDAPVVIAVAPQIEALYTTLRRNAGLPHNTGAEKQVIEVSVTQPPGRGMPWFDVPERIIVPSPAIYLAPVELTDEELLAQSIVLPLIEKVLAQASEQAQLDPVWRPLAQGLRLWQLWDLALPLAAWREEVVTWIYADLPTSRLDQGFVLPDQYTELCADHKLWISSPAEIQIPLLCTEVSWESFYLSPWGWYEPLIHLDQLDVPLRPREYLEEMSSHHVRHPGQTVALATLIDYAVTTYGHERLPVLVAGLGQYDTWETLLPAVFDVSPATFEAGWQAYLAARYGVSVP
jgi:hypothetical protein